MSVAFIALAVFVLPGFIIAVISGCKIPVAAGVSIPVSFGVYGLAAWFYGNTEWRYTVASVAIFWGFVALLAVLWRAGFAYAHHRKRPRDDDPVTRWRTGGLFDPLWILPAAGVVAGTTVITKRAMGLLEDAKFGIDNIYQGWDVHWHASVIRFIDDTGIASSTRMGELQNVDSLAQMYYPTGWHAGAWLVMRAAGLDPIAATNITGLVLPAVLLPVCGAAFAWRAVGNRGLTAQIAAGLAAIIVTAIPALYPIGIYVGMWPYIAGVFMTGAVMAIFMTVPSNPQRAFAAAMAFIGTVETHPAAATIPVLTLALWWLTYAVWRPAVRRPGIVGGILTRLRDVGLLAATGGVGALLLLPQILTGANQTEEVSSFTAVEAEDHAEAWSRAAELLTRHAVDFGPNWPLLWAGVAGGVIVLVWRGNLWAPLFYGISLSATAYSLLPFEGPFSGALGALGALHYNTGHRLVMPVAILTATGAAIALAAVGRLVLLGPVKKLPRTSAALAVIAALIGGAVLAPRIYAEEKEAYSWALNAARDGRMVDDTDLKAFQWLAKQPHAFDGHILSNPAEGSGWMYAYNGLPALFRHYLWPTTDPDSDTNVLFWKTHLLGAGNFGNPDEPNRIDEAARRLRVNYIYVSPPSYWAFQLPLPSMETWLWDAPGVTPVYLDKQVRIFAVNEAFTDEELEQLRAPGNSPQPLAPLEGGFHRPNQALPSLMEDPFTIPDPA